MKTNDVIYCIKDVYFDFMKCHTKGRFYKFTTNIETHQDNSTYIYISSDPGKTLADYLGFIVTEGDTHQYDEWDRFNEHFIDIKTYRKQKLQKLYNETEKTM